MTLIDKDATIGKDGKLYLRTSLNRRGDYIKVRATRKVLKYIEEKHPDIPIVQQNDV